MNRQLRLVGIWTKMSFTQKVIGSAGASATEISYGQPMRFDAL